MPQIGKQGFNPYLHKPIPKNKIERAIKENDSMSKAAQSLHVAYNTFKKYAKQYDKIDEYEQEWRKKHNIKDVPLPQRKS